MTDHPDPNACSTMGGGKPTSAYCMINGCAGMNATLPELIKLVTLTKGLNVYAVWESQGYHEDFLVSLHLTENAAIERCVKGNEESPYRGHLGVAEPPFNYVKMKVED